MIDSNSDRLKGSILNDGLSSSTPDKFLLSEKLSPVHSSMSFPDDEHPNFPLYRGKASKILDILTTYINDSTQTFKDLSQSMSILLQARNNFFKLAEREADREIHEKKYDIERHKENLMYMINELKNHEKTIKEALNTADGPTDIVLNIVKERAEKTIDMYEEEKSRNKVNLKTLDLEIVSKKVLKEIKEKNTSLSKEVERFKLRNHEMTPDTARIRPLRSPEGLDPIEEVDNILCQRISELSNFLQEFVSLKAEKGNFKHLEHSPYNSGFDPYFSLKCFDQFRVLEQKIISTLKFQADKVKNFDSDSDKNNTSIKRISPSISLRSADQKKDEEVAKMLKDMEKITLSNQALNRLNHEQAQEIQEIKSKLSQSVQETYLLKQKISASKAYENELNMALRNQELSFEEKMSEIKSETQNDVQKMQEMLHSMCEGKGLKARIDELEAELQKAKRIIENNSNPSFERELDNVRKIYNDKYEELFKISSSQITELEQKLLESNHTIQFISDEVRNSVRKEEQKQKEQEFQRLNQIHNRELRLIQAEFEDFLIKTKNEVIKLGKLVEKAINTSDVNLLNSLKDDIQIFTDKIHTKAKIVKEESFSLSLEDERLCKRCGLNDNKSRFCSFHPFLVNADAQEFLYSPEWHKCRESRHNHDTPPCVKTANHCYTTENNTNFIKIFDSFHAQNLTFANNKSFDKEKLDSPSRTLHDALFSTSKKENPDKESATELLDSYLLKYS